MEESARPTDPEELLSHRDWIRGLARRLVHDEHTAEDVAQDTMATALSRRPPVLHSLRGWLTTVTRSRAIDRQRSESARAVREQRSRPRSVPSTADLVARADAQRAVAAAVMELDEPYRTTVLLRHFEDLTPTEIGERRGVPRETVRTRLRRAHAQLREKLDAEFGGDRDRWRAALLPLLGPALPGPSPARPGVPEATTTTAGALAMSNTSKLAVAAAALLLLLAGGAAVSTLAPGDDDTVPVVVAESPVTEDEPQVEEPEVLAEPRTLTGRVRRRSDGAPVANVSLVLPVRGGRDVRTATASDGSFTLDAPAGASPLLSVAATGFIPETVALQPDVDDLGTIWVALGARLLVRVENAAGDTVAGIPVLALRWRNHGDRAHVDSSLRGMTSWDAGVVEKRRSVSGADGIATIESARVGMWRVVADGVDFGTKSSAFIYVRPGAREVEGTVVLAERASLSGRVLAADQAPVHGALVSAEIGVALAGPARVRTDAEGRFRLDGLPSGTVSLSVDVAGGGPGTKLAQVQIPDVPSIDLVLPPTGRLAGRVTDEDGNGLPGETVSIEVTGTLSTVTTAKSGADGRYEFAAVPVGRIARFRLFSEDRVQLWPRIERGELVEPGDGEPTRRMAAIVAGGTTTVDAVMAAGGVITGSVSGPDGPLAGVQVWRWRKPTRNGQNWASTTTDDSGSFRFAPDLPGPVALEVRHPELFQPGLPEDVSRGLRKGEVDAAHIVEIPESGEVRAELEVVAGGPVRGRVEDADGAPVAGAAVAFAETYSAPLGRTVRSDAEGRFVLARVRPGRGRVLRATTADGVGAARFDVPPEGVADDVVLKVETSDAPAGDDTERVVTGRVLFADSGRPIAEAKVRVLAQPPMLVRGRRVKDQWQRDTVVAVTDDDGRFAVTVRGDGPHWLAAEAGDTIEEVVDVTATSDSVALRLRRSRSLSGHVRDTDGSPLAGATLIAVSGHRAEKGDLVVYSTPSAAPVEGRPGEARSRSDGGFTIHGVPAGTCKINVFRAESVADYATAMQAKPTAFGPFEAGAEGLDLRMDAPQRASLRLRVVRPDGAPVTIGSIRYVPEGALHGGFVNLRSEDGRVTIPDTADPTYAVRVTAYSEPRTTRVFRGVAPGETEHELVMAPGPTITGRVVDSAGNGIAKITVHARRVGPFDMLSSYNATADTEGRFVLRDLEEATYALQTGTSPSGWRRLVKAVEARPGDTGVEIRTTSEGRISGVVVDANGAALPNVQLSFYRPLSARASGQVPHTSTDENGRFEMSGLDPGLVWTIEPSLTPHDPKRQRELRIDVSVGQTDVRIVLPAKE